MNKNYVSVPATQAEDINIDVTTWRNGKCISIDEGTHITIFIDHQESTVTENPINGGDEVEKTVVSAFPIRVEKPVSRASLINAAEQQAYNLKNAMDVASFNASLARNNRNGNNESKIKEHDDFILWVGRKLDEIGYVSVNGIVDLETAKESKIEEIIEYDKSRSVNEFLFSGVPMWLDKETRGGLRIRLEAEQALGKTDTTLWYGLTPVPLKIADGLKMLVALEVYASACYDTTAQHKANVDALTTIEDVNAYDYTTNPSYPKKLSL